MINNFMTNNIPTSAWPPPQLYCPLLPTCTAINDDEFSLQDKNTVPTIPPILRNPSSDQNQFPSSSGTKKIWRNGYESAPKTVLYMPYVMLKRGASKHTGFSIEVNYFVLKPLPPFSVQGWNALAHSFSLLKPTLNLCTFQMQGSNLVIACKKDLILILWTGSGKSVLFCLALHAQKRGISIVVTPYTTLGREGAEKCVLFFSFSLVQLANHQNIHQ